MNITTGTFKTKIVLFFCGSIFESIASLRFAGLLIVATVNALLFLFIHIQQDQGYIFNIMQNTMADGRWLMGKHENERGKNEKGEKCIINGEKSLKTASFLL